MAIVQNKFIAADLPIYLFIFSHFKVGFSGMNYEFFEIYATLQFMVCVCARQIDIKKVKMTL